MLRAGEYVSIQLLAVIDYMNVLLLYSQGQRKALYRE